MAYNFPTDNDSYPVWLPDGTVINSREEGAAYNAQQEAAAYTLSSPQTVVNTADDGSLAGYTPPSGD